MLAAAIAPSAAGQLSRDSATVWLAAGGGEAERYLRTLQVAGLAPPTMWTIRPFSAAELVRLTPAGPHPWARVLAPGAPGTSVRLIAPELTAIVNTRFPYGLNDGPIWAGRGLTTAASFGVQARVGPVELTLAPEVFRAENAPFPLAPNGLTGPQAYADPSAAAVAGIDLPQRFGDGAYQRFDLGQSALRLRVGPVGVGVSTANEVWGPAIESPFLLGANAAGFLHAFAGTDRPVRIGPLSGAVRVIVGRLDQSSYSPTPPNQRRVLTGAIITGAVRQLPGLEVGLARLFESVWPDSGLSVSDLLGQLGKNPLKAHLASGLGSKADNQIASLFARWSFPASRVELYGELGREDNAYDLRDLALEPDHDLAFMLGLQRVWTRADSGLLVFRAELLNSAITDLARLRQQAPPYVHNKARQGHTQLGQLLGAPSGYGGGGSLVALEWVSPSGRRTFSWRRMRREPTTPPALPDVMHALTAEWLIFRPRVDLVPEGTVVYNLNRDAGGDPINLRGAVTARVHW